jgi:hypothetical protein
MYKEMRNNRPDTKTETDLFVVVDNSAVVQIMRDEIERWLNGLLRQDVFRRIVLVDLDSSASATGEKIFPEVSDEVVWVLSDCVNAKWHSGELFRKIEQFPYLVQIVQVLPFSLWGRTALGRGLSCRLSMNWDILSTDSTEDILPECRTLNKIPVLGRPNFMCKGENRV